jgi:3',5'-cyclic AMP phosphodiesterase CpdA/CheY-like chemotaxis protein
MKKQRRTVLWADDDVIQFDSCARILKAYLDAQGIAAEIRRAVDGNAVYRELHDGTHFDLLVLDIEMPSFSGIDTVRDLAAKHLGLPMIIVSGKTKKPGLKETLDELSEQGMIRGYFEASDHAAWCEASLQVLRTPRIKVLHISDLHFGRFHGFHGPQLLDLIDHHFMQAVGPEPVDYLVVSGDLGSEGKSEDFRKAGEFLDAMVDRLGLERSRVVIVPGNHDIFRTEEAEGRFLKYLEFLNQFYRGARSSLKNYYELYNRRTRKLVWREHHTSDSLFSVTVDDEYRVVIIALNSVITQSERWNLGEITGFQLKKIEAVLAHLSSIQATYLRLAVFHHHLFHVPSPFSPTEQAERVVLNQGMILRHLIENGISVILHGHSHYGAAYEYGAFFFGSSLYHLRRIVVSASGTLSGKHRHSAQSAYQFTILRLQHGGRCELHPFQLTDDSLGWKPLGIFFFNLET